MGLGQWMKRRIKRKGAVDKVGWNNKGGVGGKLTDRVEVKGKVRDAQVQVIEYLLIYEI